MVEPAAYASRSLAGGKGKAEGKAGEGQACQRQCRVVEINHLVEGWSTT